MQVLFSKYIKHTFKSFHYFPGVAAAAAANDNDMIGRRDDCGMLIPLLAEKGNEMRNNMIGYFYHLNVA